MKVRILRDNVFIAPHSHVTGDVVAVPDERALDLVDAGAAELVDAIPPVTLEGVEALRHRVAQLPK